MSAAYLPHQVVRHTHHFPRPVPRRSLLSFFAKHARLPPDCFNSIFAVTFLTFMPNPEIDYKQDCRISLINCFIQTRRVSNDIYDKNTALYFGSHLANLFDSMIHDGGPEKPRRPSGKDPSGLGFRVM